MKKMLPILAQFAGKPALIRELNFQAWLQRCENRMAQLGIEACDDCDEDENDPFRDLQLKDLFPPIAQYRVEEGVAVIPVHGVIGRGFSKLEQLICGVCDIDQIEAWVEQAAADESVQVIVFDFNTPGGAVTRIPEVAELIASLDKPTFAVVDELCASGGYWLAAACDAIIATPSADLGSIGVYLMLLDWSGFYEDVGVKVELIKSGKYKGIGAPGTSLTDDQRALLQADVVATHAQFKKAACRNRTISNDDMEGQCFVATTAVEKGMADDVVRSKSEFIDELRSRVASK